MSETKNQSKRLVACPSKALSVQLFGLVCLVIFSNGIAAAQATDPIAIPLKHVNNDDDPSDFDALGIMIGVNGSTPRLYQFDTGSDEFLGQIDASVPGVGSVPGKKPEFYPYGEGTYGYWMQTIQFGQISFYHPDKPTDPVATISGKYGAGQILDWVFTKNHQGFKDHKMSDKPIGYDDGTPLYAELDVRKRIRNGEPSDHPPFYGTFGTGDYIDEAGPSASLGAQTKTGYVIAANANIGDAKTPGCAPCLTLNLKPEVRAQFTALTSWGKLDYEFSQRKFPGSGTNASNQHEGNFSYTISFSVGKKKRAVELKGPILFDTGTPEFVYLDRANALKKLKSKGFKLEEYDDTTVDIQFNGFSDKLNNLEYDDVTATRLADEDDGDGLILGLEFFHQNALLYDLEHRITAYSPYFVTAEDFTTDGTNKDDNHLGRITTEMGSSGWLGLAGHVSGDGDLVIEKDASVNMSGTNTYTGATHIAADGYLHLAGLGSIEHSSRVIVDGSLFLNQKGDRFASWGVPAGADDAVFRDIAGKGDIFLGSNRLVLTAADGTFEGTISDYDDGGKSQGGGLVVKGGRLTLADEIEISGMTEVAAGAELHVTGELYGDVSVSGKLVVDGKAYGTVRVNKGGQLMGTGAVGSVAVLPGGTASKMKTTAID